MSDNNGWPDPARPGVPMNPERDGWHWVQRVDKGFVPSPRIILWTDDWTSREFSWDAVGYEDDERKLGRDFRYLGPCLTPAEVEARVTQARRDALEEAAREIDCGCDIRAAVLERLKTQGERQAERLCPKGDTCCALQSAAIRALKKEGDE